MRCAQQYYVGLALNTNCGLRLQVVLLGSEGPATLRGGWSGPCFRSGRARRIKRVACAMLCAMLCAMPFAMLCPLPWNPGNRDLTNREILEIAMKCRWQVGHHLAVSTAKHDFTNREVSQIAMQMPWQDVLRFINVFRFHCSLMVAVVNFACARWEAAR